ncbi:hypothetical protein [Sphingomonas sp.]|uniref:hypothetical protein n=1 Tax=Sphingomonas sp. TaxID=28214 RepID=UPI001ED5C803|nr:hypothetical protein [Sphingomonas sp.]MBX3594505.1 hypothetical protein [Sphingomonas sp.]
MLKGPETHIPYKAPDLKRLSRASLGLWATQDGNRQRAEIEYLIRYGRFNATLIYPEDIDPEGASLDRRDRIVARYFGDKPIMSPPIGDDVPRY